MGCIIAHVKHGGASLRISQKIQDLLHFRARACFYWGKALTGQITSNNPILLTYFNLMGDFGKGLRFFMN
jgi:hypothetical protein